MADQHEDQHGISRRQFLKLAGAAGLALQGLEFKAFGRSLTGAYNFFEPVAVDNPLASYPDRGWEKVYRDIYRSDRSFTFLCAPNDTHNCLLRAHVKNNVVTRIEPTYGYKHATDLYGNQASSRWDPRCCQKGLILARRFYGDRRIKHPMIRKGFKDWVDAGFPRDGETGRPPEKYFQRGRDGWVRLKWDDAFTYQAKALMNISETYSGKKGEEYLHKQGYDPAMIEAMHGHGTQAIKVRGGMALLGATRIFGLYRFSNMLALLDAKIQDIGPDKAKGARGWDSYAWHTDLPPGHPMVTGMQTNDFELFTVEHANQVLVWGMNWITTKMPDSHWLTEARLKGTKVVAITCEYSATANKADQVLIIRPGTDPALALGFSHIILRDKLYDQKFIEQHTDLPLLVRMDTLQTVRADEVFNFYRNGELTNGVKVVKAGEVVPPVLKQGTQFITAEQREQWGDFVVWDKQRNEAVSVTRDEVGSHFAKKGVAPALEGTFKLRMKDGKTVEVRPVFDLVKQYVMDNFDPATVSEITRAPVDAIETLAKQIAANKEKTLFAIGIAPNQFFNNDLKDRAVFLLAALTRNLGFPGGNVGSYSGNWRVDQLQGIPQYIAEDPFHIELDPAKAAKVKKYDKKESAHYFNYDDRPLRQHGKLFTGESHMPTPTKMIWLSNSNSIIANAKWHYNVVFNTLPRVECLSTADWWWTATTEYSDIVWAVDSWAELKAPDMTASCTNPFVQIFPRTPLKRAFDTRGDVEVLAGVANKLAEMTGDKRFSDYWHFANEHRMDVYLQRIINASPGVVGYDIGDLESKAQAGTPAIVHSRTYPRLSSWEQIHESQPWYTKSGRLEFFRPEKEWQESGENLPVYREPVDSTFYDPNVIVAKPHPAIRPLQPEAFKQPSADRDSESRQVRHVVAPWSEVAKTKHPLMDKEGYRFVYHTPKYRHGAHSTPIDTDFMATLFGPFGDMYRRDKRTPAAGEGYVDINPADARALGINDGDYIRIEADPEDRPFRNWKERPAEFKVGHLMCRARYYPGTPRGILRTWHNMYGATIGSVKGHELRPDGLARNQVTGYQSMYRYGSHQSATRAWLKPTLMTESLVHRTAFSHVLGQGFEADIHGATGAPREAFVKIYKAEDGGYGGKGLWRPVQLGFRPANESPTMKHYLNGEYVK
jgi:nitrate reductase alpha subunit